MKKIGILILAIGLMAAGMSSCTSMIGGHTCQAQKIGNHR
jgi:hypothetical protein